MSHVSTNLFVDVPEAATARAARLGEQLADLIETEMGDIHRAATVDYQPSAWYAAHWVDWLLVAAGRAAVLHLGWDS